MRWIADNHIPTNVFSLRRDRLACRDKGRNSMPFQISADTVITSASIFIAVLIYVIGSFERRAFEKRQNTVKLISKFHDAGPVQEALAQLVQWKREKRVFPDDKVSPEEDGVIIVILDYYDFLAASTIKRDVSRTSVLQYVAGAMIADYRMLEGYVAARRIALKRPKLYASFESFVRRFEKSRLVY